MIFSKLQDGGYLPKRLKHILGKKIPHGLLKFLLWRAKTHPTEIQKNEKTEVKNSCYEF